MTILVEQKLPDDDIAGWIFGDKIRFGRRLDPNCLISNAHYPVDLLSMIIEQIEEFSRISDYLALAQCIPLAKFPPEWIEANFSKKSKIRYSK